MIGEFDGSPFATEYNERRAEIDKLSNSQRVPGMKPDEVHSELVDVLWHAFQTFDPDRGLTLGQWWWVLWLRRKRDLIEAFFARKNSRPHTTPSPFFNDELAELAEAFGMFELLDSCPSTDRIERAVWRMIVDGFPNVEIRSKLRLSVRKFYAILAQWQTDDLRRLLMDAPT